LKSSIPYGVLEIVLAQVGTMKAVLASLALAWAVNGLSLNVANSGGNATQHSYGIMYEDISHSGDGGM
jgi:hypothetical protein